MSARLTTAQIWGAPILLGITTTVGLIAALFGDGIWDAVSWAALATPVAVCWRCLGFPRRPASMPAP